MRVALKIIISGLLLVSVAASLPAKDTSAADARQFNAGRIIDDGVFTNSSSMSVDDIQRFLESKVSCDTWGTKRSELGGGTRAQWMSARGISAPFRCITDYKENPANRQNNYSKNETPLGAISAAQIIYNYSRQFNINPQVLIATLQKENSLITDEWPTPKQFSESMGFGCPDNVAAGAPACDPTHGSFSAQIYQAARHFRGYIDNASGWWIPFNTGWNSIAWSPTASCGRGDVYIENRATVALYSYTPYQPNQAAKNAQYGSGDGCSAYGNRNFYMYFTDWFGSVYDSISTSGLQITKDSVGQIFTGKPVQVSFTLKNNTKSTYSFKNVGVAVRGPSGQNYDPGWSGAVSIRPGESYVYNRSFTPTIEGGYKIYISSYADQDGDWRECYLDSSQNTCYNPKIIQHPVVITDSPVVKDGLSGDSTEEIRQGRSFSVDYKVKNTSQLYSVNLGKVMVVGRTSDNKNRDLQMKTVGSLSANSEYTYSAVTTLTDSVGTKYTFYPSVTKNDGKTYEDKPFATSQNTTQQTDSIMKTGLSLTQGPVVVGGDAVIGGRVTIEMKLRNYAHKAIDLGRIGVTVRGPQGQNLDPLWQRVESLSGNVDDGIVTYRASFAPTVTGDWKVSYMQTTANYTSWDSSYPVSDNGAVKRSITVPVKDAVTLIQGPQIEGGVYVNKPSIITMKIKTSVKGPIDIGRAGVTVRGPQGQNFDPLWQRLEGLSSDVDDGILTYSAPFRPSATGKWSIGFMAVTSDYKVWDANKIKSDSSAVARSITVDVKPQVTVTSSVSLTGVNLGTQVASVVLTNHGDNAVDLGKIGLAVRDSNGANRDGLWENFVIPANSSKEHRVTANLNVKGRWTFELTSYKNGKWSTTDIASDSSSIQRKITIDVR